MEYDIYTADQLYAVMMDERQTISTSQWRNFFTHRTVLSDQEYIRFDEIDASRKIAPFMQAHMPGRPIYREDGERLQFYKPAYTKPKDAVVPGDSMAMTGPEITRRVPLQTPQSRVNQKIIRITQFHRQSIERLWDYLFAKSLMDGFVTIQFMTDEGIMTKAETISYGRDPGHTVLNGGDWGDANTDILGAIETWVDVVANAKFGGPVDTVLLGSTAAKNFRRFFRDKDQGQRYLDTTIQGAEQIYVNRGIIRTDPLNPFTYLGRLDGNLDVWRVSGMGNQFQKDDGTFETIVGENDVVLAAPSAEMIMAFGAIQEIDALRAQAIYVKMFDDDDPSARYILSQSAPLPIVVNPNATFKATVSGA